MTTVNRRRHLDDIASIIRVQGAELMLLPLMSPQPTLVFLGVWRAPGTRIDCIRVACRCFTVARYEIDLKAANGRKQSQ